MSAALAAAVVAGVLTGWVQAQAAAPLDTPPGRESAAGTVPDPYYPDDGNPGYDVATYSVDLDYYRRDESIRAITTIRSSALAALSQFHLDLVRLEVLSVEVNGRPADFDRRGAHELVITPAQELEAGEPFVTVVTYQGKPGQDPVFPPSGWFSAQTPGAGFIAGEPHACTLWFPCNDHPTDKATFSLTATVPRPFAVVSNGDQLPTTSGTRGSTAVRTYRWRLDEPTATYLTTMYIDKLTFERSRLADGTPVVSAYGPNPGTAPQVEAKLPEILRVLSRRWGPYPAPSAGGIFVRGAVPFALETFTRPIYGMNVGAGLIVHENGHQWWGDNVSVERWRDICLNECLASYSEWLWDEHNGEDLDARYRHDVRTSPSWFDEPLYDMGALHEFDDGVYVKGPYFFHAVRNKIGDAEFFAAMRGIQRKRSEGNMSMLELRDALERRTGTHLHSMWREWVLETGVPSRRNLYPGDLGR